MGGGGGLGFRGGCSAKSSCSRRVLVGGFSVEVPVRIPRRASLRVAVRVAMAVSCFNNFICACRALLRV